MRTLRTSAISRLLCLSVFLSAPAFVVAQSADVAIRAELATPLQDVQRLFREKQFAPALKALAQAEAVPNRTEDENILIERLRAAVASNAGDLDQTAVAYERLTSFAKVPAAEKLQYLEVLSTVQLRRKAFANSAKAAQRYFDEGGKKPSIRLVLAQAAFFANDAATTVTQTSELIALARQANVAPEKDILMLRANAQQKLKDETGYIRTLETLVEFHPQPAYWNDLLGRVQSESGFSADQLLDLYRLQYATQSLGAGEAQEMAQLAIKQGLPLEAVRALKQVETAGVADADRAAVADALKQAEALVAADAAAGASVNAKAGAQTGAPAGKPVSVQAGVQVKGQAGAKKADEPAKAKGPSFNSLYQRWLSAPGAEQASAIAAAFAADGVPAVTRLRLAAVQAQSGQMAEAKASFEALRTEAGVGRLAALWLLHLKRASGG